MSTKILMIFAVLLIFACQASAGWITNVSVSPSQPSNIDLITFNISGTAPGTSSWVDYDAFSQNGTSFLLDVYVEVGNFGTVSNWYYAKQIQPLTLGTYNFEVRAVDNSIGSPGYGTVRDTYNMNFSVTPEPATIFLLGLGAILARKKSVR